MNQYNLLNVKLSNLQLNKLKSAIINGTKVTLIFHKIWLEVLMIKLIFSHKLLLTNTQVSKIRKAFANGSLANIKFSKSQLLKIGQSGWFLDRLLGPLLKTGLPLIGNVLKPLAESVLLPLGLTAAASGTDAIIQSKSWGSGTTNLIT